MLKRRFSSRLFFASNYAKKYFDNVSQMQYGFNFSTKRVNN